MELMLVLGLAALLLALAVPAMGSMFAARTVSSWASIFISDLHLTRSEAILHNGRAVMCKSADGLQCGLTGGWEQGWIVFHDTNNNAQLDPEERVVQVRGVAPGLEIRGNTPVAGFVSYSASGRAKLVSGAFQAGTFTLCARPRAADLPAKRIILGGPGRPRLQAGSAADCA